MESSISTYRDSNPHMFINQKTSTLLHFVEAYSKTVGIIYARAAARTFITLNRGVTTEGFAPCLAKHSSSFFLLSALLYSSVKPFQPLLNPYLYNITAIGKACHGGIRVYACGTIFYQWRNVLPLQRFGLRRPAVCLRVV